MFQADVGILQCSPTYPDEVFHQVVLSSRCLISAMKISQVSQSVRKKLQSASKRGLSGPSLIRHVICKCLLNPNARCLDCSYLSSEWTGDLVNNKMHCFLSWLYRPFLAACGTHTLVKAQLTTRWKLIVLCGGYVTHEKAEPVVWCGETFLFQHCCTFPCTHKGSQVIWLIFLIL